MVVSVEADGFSVALDGLEKVFFIRHCIHHYCRRGWGERERIDKALLWTTKKTVLKRDLAPGQELKTDLGFVVATGHSIFNGGCG